jgi:hypothetical protein
MHFPYPLPGRSPVHAVTSACVCDGDGGGDDASL